jgi:predicted metalloenzyme YecM
MSGSHKKLTQCGPSKDQKNLFDVQGDIALELPKNNLDEWKAHAISQMANEFNMLVSDNQSNGRAKIIFLLNVKLGATHRILTLVIFPY